MWRTGSCSCCGLLRAARVSHAASPRPASNPPGHSARPAETLNTSSSRPTAPSTAPSTSSSRPDDDRCPRCPSGAAPTTAAPGASVYRTPEARTISLDAVVAGRPGHRLCQHRARRRTRLAGRARRRAARAATPVPLGRSRSSSASMPRAPPTAWERQAEPHRRTPSFAAASGCDDLRLASRPIRSSSATVVDPNSVGPARHPWTWRPERDPRRCRTDGGTTWRSGASLGTAARASRFAGPAARTLFAPSATSLGLARRRSDLGLDTPVPAAPTSRPRIEPTVDLADRLARAVRADSRRRSDLPRRSPSRPRATSRSTPRRQPSLRGRGDDQTAQSTDGGAVGATSRTLASASHSRTRRRGSGRASTRRAGRAPSGSRTTWEPPGRACDGRRRDAGSAIVSRDDPLTAYIFDQPRLPTRARLRTRDGGAPWQAVALPPDPGAAITVRRARRSAARLLAHRGDIWESARRRRTWTVVPLGRQCLFGILRRSPPARPVSGSTAIRGWDYSPPSWRAPLPSPGPLRLARAAGRVRGGRHRHAAPRRRPGDWSWSPLLAPTADSGRSRTASALTAWPAHGGTTFVA